MSLSAGFPYMSRGAGFLQMGLTPLKKRSVGAPTDGKGLAARKRNLRALFFEPLKKLTFQHLHTWNPPDPIHLKKTLALFRKIWQYWVTIFLTPKRITKTFLSDELIIIHPIFFTLLPGFGKQKPGDFVELLDFPHSAVIFWVTRSVLSAPFWGDLGPENPPFFSPQKKKHQFSTFQEGPLRILAKN